jgi:hypothetical protein
LSYARRSWPARADQRPRQGLLKATDCGQMSNVYPSDCLALAARGMRANGVSQRELDLMYKVNPAKLLGLSPPEGVAMTP